MRRKSYELWLAFFAILFITVVYLFMIAFYGEVPAASGFYGHAMGILGFLLMLMTETLYTLRKRSRKARWGRMSDWLEFHIFTGLVGPYLVLLHTSWKFNGVAGVLTLLTLIIVASGFLGRYIYSAVPRTADGIEVEKAELEAQIAELDREVTFQQARRPEPITAPAGRPAPVAAGMNGPEGPWRLGWFRVNRMQEEQRKKKALLKDLERRQKLLHRQVSSLATTRQLMAIWHAVHIPLGLSLFILAGVHIVAAVYFAQLMK